MVLSMTGFARTVDEMSLGQVVWEIKSVNHRYLELGFRLPELFRRYELDCRNVLQQHFARGKFDVSLKFKPSEHQPPQLTVNEALVKQLGQCADQAGQLLSTDGTWSIMPLLTYPGVLLEQEQSHDGVKEALLSSLSKAANSLMSMRSNEGAGLKLFIEERLEGILNRVAQLEAELPGIMDRAKSRLQDKVSGLKVDVDADRFEQEVVLLLQKADVAEELHRLTAHVGAVREVLLQQEPMGRRLDFLMQELNREANTLSSKAVDSSITNIAVELKVLVEQMREQVQNIE